MQTPASLALAAVAHWLAGFETVTSSESAVIRYLTMASMNFTGAILSVAMCNFRDSLRPRARKTGNWIPCAITGAMKPLTLLCIGPVVAFAIFYPGASTLEEVCGTESYALSDPCDAERLRLWTLALIEPGGWRLLRTTPASAFTYMILTACGLEIILDLWAVPLLERIFDRFRTRREYAQAKDGGGTQACC